jgi:hypothetical protein
VEVAHLIDLKSLSVEELTTLRKQATEELTQRKLGGCEFTEFEFENPDDRSYGSLSFTAKTPHGVLTYKAMVGHNYFDDIEWKLDGVDVSPDCDGVDEGEFGDSTSEEQAKEACAEAVGQFVEWYTEFKAEG